jgi:hypothetical protein
MQKIVLAKPFPNYMKTIRILAFYKIIFYSFKGCNSINLESVEVLEF